MNPSLTYVCTLLDESADAHDRVYNDKHEGHLSHELIGGAASFAAFKAYEDKRKDEGT